MMRYVSLFSGIGGLDRAIDSLGGECIAQVEIEAYPRSILDLRWPDVPKHGDVRTFHPPPCDLVVGGPPCQPVSHAGRRKGSDDERWLWGEALRVVSEARPATVFFENPMGLRTLGLDDVLAGLTELGYGGAWEVVAAADAGAPHLRKRIFIMGVAGRSGWEGPTRPPGSRKALWPTPRASEWKGVGPLGSKSHEYRLAKGYLDATVQDREQRTGALSPDWVEWLMGLPIGWTDIGVVSPGPLHDWNEEPAIPRVGLGIPSRSKRLIGLGNAVVSAQAVMAWQKLTERLA